MNKGVVFYMFRGVLCRLSFSVHIQFIMQTSSITGNLQIFILEIFTLFKCYIPLARYKHKSNV